MGSRDDVTGIMVRLTVGGEQSLFILLGHDGSINRMGSGSVEHFERDMFIGVVPGDLFLRVRSQITPGIEYFLGQALAAPNPKGKLCELTVGLQYADGREAMSGWRYGSESQGPHPEVCAFVSAAVEATEPWFQREREKVRRYKSRSPE